MSASTARHPAFDRITRFFGGASLSKALPQRIYADIRNQQFRAEILIAVVQLAIVAFFSVMYFVVPATFAPGAPVRATPLGLSLFAILVALRLWFAATDQLSPGWLAFFVITEMAVLMFTIWAYHLQFEAQPSLYLKSTGLFYAFIMIALRSLRFEPLWVILSGVVAVVGWIVLTGYALATAPGNPVTWDYVTYMASSQIHFGGEFDKILALVMVTAVLALTLARARRFLVQAVAQTQAAADLSRFFDREVAERITGADSSAAAGHGEMRNAAVLFIDMRGFTGLAAMLTPPALIQLISEYQRLLVPVIQAHHGSIDKFMGDGIMASFGAVKPSDHYAADALAAVDAILDAAQRWKSERTAAGKPAPSVGAALAAGEVVFGVIGDENRLEYTVIGDAVNLAAKLEKHTKSEGVRALATREILELAAQQGYAGVGGKKILTGRTVAGVSAPLDLAVLG
jgi:adenylate cyclase